MRLFTAIDIPAEIKRRLCAFVEPLRLLAPFGKTGGLSWSPVENLHITTKFIGEWPEGRMEELMKALHAIAKPGEIDITVRGTGWFPDEKHPRVFWAGVDADDRLAYLARSTEQGVATLGAPAEERAYSPHLTLARIRDHVSLDTLRGAIAVANSDFGAFRAGHFALYVSAGGTYTQLAKFPLQFPHEHEEGKTTWES